MFKRLSKKARVFITAMVLSVTTMVPAFASTTTELAFEFDPSSMFTWTNTMLTALMPVLYITLGISLAFIIINALKYAFR